MRAALKSQCKPSISLWLTQFSKLWTQDGIHKRTCNQNHYQRKELQAGDFVFKEPHKRYLHFSVFSGTNQCIYSCRHVILGNYCC